VTSGNWYHVSVKTIGRSAGRSAPAAAAYRLGERIHDEATHRVHDYRARSGVETSFTMAPAGAPEWAHDPERLWNAAEAAEKRKNSTLAREVELALPDATTDEARLAIVQAFSLELVNRYGVAVSAAIHHPDKEGDQRTPR
jgi:ATP-dependent exoDNAse (exonuclease V) alpha subunit